MSSCLRGSRGDGCFTRLTWEVRYTGAAAAKTGSEGAGRQRNDRCSKVCGGGKGKKTKMAPKTRPLSPMSLSPCHRDNVGWGRGSGAERWRGGLRQARGAEVHAAEPEPAPPTKRPRQKKKRVASYALRKAIMFSNEWGTRRRNFRLWLIGPLLRLDGDAKFKLAGFKHETQSV